MKPPVRRCLFCGCTDDRACAEGCSWVGHGADVCTACIEELALPISKLGHALISLSVKNGRAAR